MTYSPNQIDPSSVSAHPLRKTRKGRSKPVTTTVPSSFSSASERLKVTNKAPLRGTVL
jgi:hypothetical protein